MVHNNMAKTPCSSQDIIQMDMLLENPGTQQVYGKGARRKNRFKGSDGSTSSDTTSNSFVRQESTRSKKTEKIHSERKTYARVKSHRSNGACQHQDHVI